MKEIKEGDQVKFLNDTDTGVVIRIIDREMVLVRTDEDGFEYPVLKKELLVKGGAEEEASIADEDSVDEFETVENTEVIDTSAITQEEPQSTQDEHIISIQEKYQPTKEKPKKVKKSSIEEVDLHIKEIIEDPSGLSSGEIVEIQLARFRTALEGAIRAKQKRIIFIHGKGAGKLKYDIQKIISNDYKQCRYQDASFREYGYGATLILIKP